MRARRDRRDPRPRPQRDARRSAAGRATPTFDADGFYPTGDLGALDADGYLWYHGRLDDMFKVKGATVYPAEVEAALRAVDGVRQAHVTDVPGDDGADAVGALVVSTAPLDELVAAARDRLSAFKVPTCWLVTPIGRRRADDGDRRRSTRPRCRSCCANDGPRRHRARPG